MLPAQITLPVAEASQITSNKKEIPLLSTQLLAELLTALTQIVVSVVTEKFEGLGIGFTKESASNSSV